jgi:beta-N-acetylhexosaminidase
VLLFAQNVVDDAQVAGVCRQLRAARADVVIAIDEEGGDVTRLDAERGSDTPSPASFGFVDDTSLTADAYADLGSRIHGLGIDITLAPCADINSNALNPIIGVRSFGSTADVVARQVVAAIEGFHRGGVSVAAKHFPGHGDTTADSHHELPLVEHPPERLREVEWVPFKAAADAGVAAIMTAHVFVPALDEVRPATLSRRIVTDLLRRELPFDGVIFSDDLEMKAIASAYDVPAAAVMAIEAGCDGALICSGDHDTQAAALEALVHAVEEERLPLSRVEDALRRQQRAKERFLAAAVAARPPAARALRSALGRDEHRAVADEMARFL